MRSKITVATGISFAVFSLLSLAERAAQPEYWKGTLDINAYDFTELTELRSSSGDRTSRSYRVAEITNRKYDLYQNPGAIVRWELTYTSRNRPIGQPMDVTLLNYNEGYELTFDRGGSQAERSPLSPPVQPLPVEPRRILGHLCRGFEYQWQQQGLTMRRQAWFATDMHFRDPLLLIHYTFSRGDTLQYLEIRVITRLQPVSSLPGSLFEPPSGLKEINVPDVN